MDKVLAMNLNKDKKAQGVGDFDVRGVPRPRLWFICIYFEVINVLLVLFRMLSFKLYTQCGFTGFLLCFIDLIWCDMHFFTL